MNIGWEEFNSNGNVNCNVNNNINVNCNVNNNINVNCNVNNNINSNSLIKGFRMKVLLDSRWLIFFLLSSVIIHSCKISRQEEKRAVDFNFGWKFSLEEHPNAFDPSFDDGHWRALNLPHDWVIENKPDSTFKFWQATGRIPGKGIGWYRKTFKLDIEEDEVCYVLFDGIYNNATVWINGSQLGFHPYGYSPFYYDLTSYLNRDGKENVLVVKVDHTRYADSRWYTGAGIYRNVELIKTNKLHIPIWGTFITTPEVSSESANVRVQVKIRNDFYKPKNISLNTSLVAPGGITIAQKRQEVNIDEEKEFIHEFDLKNPLLWDTKNPHLYTAINWIEENGEVVDIYETRFGIRSIKFDAEEGFFLNGEHTLIKGVCLHHDAGLVGTAVPKGVWRRRLEILKAAGCNAIRSAHNPVSSEFLDLCDEMGFLVQDEFFDEWDYPKDKRFNMNQQSVHYETQGYVQHFQDWAEKDIATTILSHRNHPSIIQWSIGNEIEWTYPRNQDATGFFNNLDWNGNYFWSEPPFSPEKISQMLEILPKEEFDIGETAQKLSDWTRQYDTTRPVTANCILPSVSHLNGYADALDVIGYSYRRVLYDYGHQNYPDVPIMGTENVPQYHEWKAVIDHPHIAGTFLWTGIQYMGEVHGDWPTRTNGSGLLDLAGYLLPPYHMFKSLWSDTPHIYMTTNKYDQIKYQGKQIYRLNQSMEVEEYQPGAWKEFVWGWQSVNEHWNYQEGDTIIVEIITNSEQVELFLNDKSLGIKNRASFEDNILKWAVIYEPGVLKAVGQNEIDYQYETAWEPHKMEVRVDKSNLMADNYDVAHIEVQLVDSKGVPVRLDDKQISFEVDEKLKVLGVDNGATASDQAFQSDKVMTHKGRALLIVQAKRKPGTAMITIRGEGVIEELINLKLNILSN